MSLRDPLDKWAKYNSFISFVNLIIVGLILALVVISLASCSASGQDRQAPDHLLMRTERVGPFLGRYENSEAVCYANSVGLSCFKK